MLIKPRTAQFLEPCFVSRKRLTTGSIHANRPNTKLKRLSQIIILFSFRKSRQIIPETIMLQNVSRRPTLRKTCSTHYSIESGKWKNRLAKVYTPVPKICITRSGFVLSGIVPILPMILIWHEQTGSFPGKIPKRTCACTSAARRFLHP